MLPQGIVWQHLRQKALDTVSSGSAVSFSSPPTLEEWLRSGAFSVNSASNRRFVLHVSAPDIGSTLLSDASFNADHAIEHSLSLRNHLSCGRWNSPAWTSVTFYYWAFHAALAITRLLGSTTWFISAASAQSLRTLSPAGTTRLGAGPYTLTCEQMLSSTQREVYLAKSGQTRVHDAIWHPWFAEIRRVSAGSMKAKATDLEARLYVAITRSANVLGDAWPSELRNALNYTAGLGYGSVRRKTPSAVYGGVAIDPPSSVREIIDRLEANTAALQTGLELRDQISAASRVLTNLTFILDLLLRDLLDEVSRRRGIDRRWLSARTAFAREHTKAFNESGWPCV